MNQQDESILRARFFNELTYAEPEHVFENMYARLDAFFRQHTPEQLGELIQLVHVFVTFSQKTGYAERCRAIRDADTKEDELSNLVRLWFTNYDCTPYRVGVPVTNPPLYDDFRPFYGQNAQKMISYPRGIQRASARLHHRGDIEALMRSPFADVIEILCANPSTRLSDVLFMASRRPTQNYLLEPLMQSAWIKQAEVRFALVANPHLKTSHALRCAFTLSHAHLVQLADMRKRVNPILRFYIHQIDTYSA